MIVSCDCGAKLKIDDAKVPDQGVRVRCPRCATILFAKKPVIAAPMPENERLASPQGYAELSGKMPNLFPQATGPRVLIAHDSDIVRAMIRNVLTEDGFRIDTASDGKEALKKVLETNPEVLVLDVGLPGIYGFDLCARLKSNPETASIKIVFVSSVYDMKRYKRTPESLYGADDYIEKHHIHDDLAYKIRKLLESGQQTAEPLKRKLSHHHDLPEMSRPPAREFEPSLLSPDSLAQLGEGLPEFVPPASMPPLPPAQADMPITPTSFSLEASIFQKEEFDIPQVDAADPDAVEKAKRFARIIVSDIALYNQEAVLEGITNGTFFELLKNDVQEGRELYEKRVPAAINARKDHYQEAFDNFITAAKKKILKTAKN
jgi:predicted Zn finger-like uncharacterized protein